MASTSTASDGEYLESYEDSPSEYVPESEDSSDNDEILEQEESTAGTSREAPSVPGVNKISKKRTRNPDAWKRNVRKLKRSKGEEYVNIKGNLVEKKRRGAPCNCRWKCCDNLSDEVMNRIFEAFYQIQNKDEQDCYLGGLLKVRTIKRRRPKTGGGAVKSHTFSYKIRDGTLEKIICKQAFTSMHGITNSRIERIGNHLTNHVLSPKDKRGRHNTRPNQIPEVTIECVKEHIKSFPRRKSHYSRSDNFHRRYLSPELNVRQMHRLYLQKYEPEQYLIIDEQHFKPKVTYSFYRRVFVENFNLSFGSPRTDTCKVCDMLDNKINSAKDNVAETNKLNAEKKVHLTKADTFYKELKEKTSLVKEDPSIEVISFDFEQNMPLPHIPSSDVFYKRQMWFYPFCVHKGSVSKSFFYVFDEVTARKSPNEVISSLHDFINNYIAPEVTTLYVFSDNCAAQNKNAVLVQFWQTLILQGRFQKIRHRYPEPGHSFLPCDRSFALVEKEKRKKERVYLPQEWKRMIENTSKKFFVKDLTQEMILNYKAKLAPFFKKQNIKNTDGQKFQISKYRIMEFSGEHKETILCSETTSAFLVARFNLLKKPSVMPLFPGPDDKLYNGLLPLKEDKLKNVMELARQYVGQTDMWYYDQLIPVQDQDILTSETDDEDD